MTRRRAAGFVPLLALTVSVVLSPPVIGQGQEPTLRPRLEAMVASGAMPAVAGAVFRADEVLAEVAVGVRKLGDPTPVTPDDIWHIGSLTKSFTSLLVARQVDRGTMSWDMTLGALLGDDAGAYAPVTLVQLLGHRAGLPPNLPNTLTIEMARSGAPVVEQRARILREMLATPPSAPPGEAFAYSNVGYIVMGAILEAKTGRAWEDLVRENIFEPLALSSAGFGPPGDPESVSQPWGHRQAPGGPLTPAAPGPMADNPAFLGPAGTIHLSLADLVRWGQVNMRGEQGEDGIVTAASFQRLHQPAVEGADYALGWLVLPTGRQRIVWHNGSNTMWYVILGFDPDENLGVVLVTNGSINARSVLDPAMQEIFNDWAR